jgi:ATP-dependent Clp protease ATP-binding subunit ClpA
MKMPKNFDPPTIEVLKEAKKVARVILKKPDIGTECLLISLLQQPGEVSATLSRSGLSLDLAMSAALEMFGPRIDSKREVSYAHLVQTGAFKNILVHAEALAKQRECRLINDSHLAVALVLHDTGIVSRLLRNLHISKHEVASRLSETIAYLPTADQVEVARMFRGFDELLQQESL